MAGDTVQCLNPAGNFDPTRFDDPRTFDPARKANRHFTFVAGVHLCLGAPLARLEVRIAFEHLLTRLPNLRLANDNDFKHIASVQFRGLRRLNVEFDPAPTVCGDRG